ncbi:hypothetical protein AB0469_35585 [Streptomyces sp. NPDC093801]|uniref:hypothetical protein n=1 Tax=Streptomyces sp. NPDC093801 TaxID=3155203 RepID=UPI00344B6614
MTKLAWAARGISAVSGAVLLGALMAPSAVAGGGADHDPQHKKKGSHSAKAAMQHKQAGPARSEDDRHDERQDEHKKKCSTARDISTAAPDYINFDPGVIFHVATDRHGHAFLNDSRNPGVWINLGILANAPQCVTDTAASVTESNPGYLYVNLLGKDGVIHQARCTTSNTPFTPANLAAACGTGFSPVQDTPV